MKQILVPALSLCLIASAYAKEKTTDELQKEAEEKLEDAIIHSGKAIAEGIYAGSTVYHGDVRGGLAAGAFAVVDARDAYEEFKDAKELFDEVRDRRSEENKVEETK